MTPYDELDADTATLSRSNPRRLESARGGACLQLELIWSKTEQSRVGECCVVSRGTVLGRGPTSEPGDPPKAEFFRQRPGLNEPTGALTAPTASRRQWLMTPTSSTLVVENVGKQALLHNGVVVERCVARPGDTLGVAGTALFHVAQRLRLLAHFSHAPFSFGAADPAGMIGESQTAWELRRALVTLAASTAHVLLLGPSGSGKELCARALHAWSARTKRDFVARNAATLPSGILEAELFGNAANYPQSGMPARSGLFGAVDGGTLFIDEIGELSERDQAAFLRVLDAGEYQRLGEDRPRATKVRAVAATNRAADALKFDLLARFSERLQVPDLNQRRGDIPLIAKAILERLSSEQASRAPYVLSLELTDALVRHQYTTNVRELERLLRLARLESSDEVLRVTPSVDELLEMPGAVAELDADTLRRTLAECNSSSEAARRLGLPSRFALHRLAKKLGVVATGKG